MGCHSISPFKIPVQNCAPFRFCKYVHIQAHLDYFLKNAIILLCFVHAFDK